MPKAEISASAANMRGIRNWYPASRMRNASPDPVPPAPATNSATTAPIKANPPAIRNPARKKGRAEGKRSKARACQRDAP